MTTTQATRNMTVQEVAEVFGVTRQRIYVMIADGKFPHATKWSRDWIIPETDVVALKRERAGKA